MPHLHEMYKTDRSEDRGKCDEFLDLITWPEDEEGPLLYLRPIHFPRQVKDMGAVFKVKWISLVSCTTRPPFRRLTDRCCSCSAASYLDQLQSNPKHSRTRLGSLQLGMARSGASRASPPVASPWLLFWWVGFLFEAQIPVCSLVLCASGGIRPFS